MPSNESPRDLNENDLSPSDDSSLTDELIKLAPKVMEELSKSGFGLDLIMIQFFRLVALNKFALRNISYLLWCDVVRWFQNDTTTKMRYSHMSKTFWKLGWRLFGGRFLHLMSGYKTEEIS